MKYDYCALTYNGVLMDEAIESYTTINVEGREIHAPSINEIDRQGGDGSIILGQKYNSRNIIVHFMIKASSDSSKRESIQKLKYILKSKEDVEFSFGDDIGKWYGRLSDATNIRYDYFQGIGTFTIKCSDPYKYVDYKIYKGNNFVISQDEYHKLIIEELEFNNTSPGELRISNETSGKKIVLSNIGRIGKIKINREDITLDGSSIVNRLDPYESTWKNFIFEDGDNIIISGADDSSISKIRRLVI